MSTVTQFIDHWHLFFVSIDIVSEKNVGEWGGLHCLIRQMGDRTA